MNDSSLKPVVSLVAFSQGVENKDYGPEQLSAYGAMGCFEEESPLQIYESTLVEKRKKKEQIVLRESSGRGHGSVADQNYFSFTIENLTRLDTLFLVQPHYLAHLQQSLRRANADRGFYLPESIRNSKLKRESEDLLTKVFKFYEEMSEKGVPLEDARFILPLYTRTNIQTSGDARELMHLFHMSKYPSTPSSASAVVNEMIEKASEVAPNLFKDWGNNYEILAWYPSAQLFASENKTVEKIIKKYDYPEKVVYFEFEVDDELVDKAIEKRDEAELSNLKHVHNGGKMEGFLFPISLAGFHQAIRQRTWDHSVEPIYHAIKRNKCVVPPTVFNAGLKEEFLKMHNEMINLYHKLVEEGVPEKDAVGVVPHSLQVFDLIHVNGWNSIHSIGKRTCTEAQWEIRFIANQLAGLIREKNPTLGRYIYPQGVVYGKCPERNNCGLCDKILEAKKKGMLK